jgi:agmatinase
MPEAAILIPLPRCGHETYLGYNPLMLIDPLGRWRELGEKPDYAGLLTFAALPYSEDPSDLVGTDVAIIGAPMDELVSDRPGARLGPRAIRGASCPPGQHLEAEIDPFATLRLVDFGDAPVIPGDPESSHTAIGSLVSAVLGAGAVPIVLGGDHSVSEPALAALYERSGPVGLVHFDAHTDTGTQVFGASFSHGTPMRHAVDRGYVDPKRYVQIGLRGYWPPAEIFKWQREVGIASYLMKDVRAKGLDAITEETIQQIGGGPVYISVDVDVLDPAFAPGTGTPEPGGLDADELLRAIRTIAGSVEVGAADVVEVAPQQIGTMDVTALVADRIVREMLVGIAASRP